MPITTPGKNLKDTLEDQFFLNNSVDEATLAYMGFISIRHAITRGVFHAIIGLATAAALFLLPRYTVVAAIATATAVFLSFDFARLHVHAINKWFFIWFGFLLRDEEKNRLTGSSYSLLGFLITTLVFHRDIAILAILFLSLGDSAATVVGIWKGRIRLWGRSIEGNVTCLVVCFSVGLPVANILESMALSVAIAGAVFATIFQALPLRMNDNLTIPIGSALAMLVTSTIT